MTTASLCGPFCSHERRVIPADPPSVQPDAGRSENAVTGGYVLGLAEIHKAVGDSCRAAQFSPSPRHHEALTMRL
jgi:hypothetical protein